MKGRVFLAMERSWSLSLCSCWISGGKWLLLAHGYAHLKELMKDVVRTYLKAKRWFSPSTNVLFPGSAPGLAAERTPNCPPQCLHQHYSTK